MVDVILLISGSSKRMAQEKALLPFSEKQSFFCHLIEVYKCLPDLHILVVVNASNEERIKKESKGIEKQLLFIRNPNPEKGRLESVLTGLRKVKKGRGVFIQNIDNPFVNADLLKGMLQNIRPNTFLVPQFNGKNGHPLLLSPELVQDLIEKADSVSDLKSYLNSQKKECFITNNKAILANINSPEEYRKWFPGLKFPNKV